MTGSSGGSRTYSLDPRAGGVSVPRLLFAFLRQRFTGTVALEQRDPGGQQTSQRTIWVRGGMPVFCDWSSPDARLGELLLRAGAIDAGGLERALEVHAAGGAMLGEVLVELELIDAAARTQALREQCARKLSELFAPGVTGGEAIVTAVEHGKGQDDELAQVNVLALLLTGIGAHYDDARIKAEMGASLGGDMVATPALARYERQFGFSTRDAKILGALARGVTMGGLMQPGVEPGRALQIVYTLWVSQMLRVGDDALQSIAKGATAAAAAQQLGVTLGQQSEASAGRTGAGARSKSGPKPAPKPAAPRPPPPRQTKSEPEPEPEPAPTPAPTPEAEAAEAEFETVLAELEAKVANEANAFALFDLSIDAERNDIRAAWAQLSKTYHPDALEGSGRAALRPRVEAVFAAMSEAYGILSNKDQREELRETLRMGGSLKAGEDTTSVVRNAFEAEMIARDADKLLRARQWARAAEMFERAHELSPQDSDIEAALYYAQFRIGSQDRQQALVTITQLSKLVEDHSACARAHYFMGLIQLGIDEAHNAKQSFASAVKLDPRNIDAERQLRALHLRERGPSSSRAEAKDDAKKKSAFGGLRGLFKKS
ncbi:J domain-containing protein [Enhygromyxa salina]|nr:J domain-containing protein [Enhygromyxa salina]